MILYHGSNVEIVEIVEIDLMKSKVGKDFGCGFYLSTSRSQAMEMAVRKTEQLDAGSAFVSEFEYDDHMLGGLNILTFESYSEEWADFVLMNRRNKTRIQAHPYDIVVGPIANDSVGFQIRRLTSGLITKEKFLEELKFMKGVTIQYFFGTEKALSRLRRI